VIDENNPNNRAGAPINGHRGTDFADGRINTDDDQPLNLQKKNAPHERRV
jgi:hypothetical protein